MSCSLTIQSVHATAQGTGSILHITVVASGCKTLQFVATCSAGTVSQIYNLTGVASETVTEDLTVPCPCGENVTITANCVDPITQLPIPGCTSGTYQGPISCGDICCVQPQVTYVAGECDANNQRSVTFSTAFNVPPSLPPTCFPLIGQLDFGDGNFGSLHIIAAAGSFSFPDTHLYAAASSVTYQAAFVYANPSSCPPLVIPVDVSQCKPVDCCRVPEIQAMIGACNELGQRDVQFQVWMDASNIACTYVFYIDFGNGQYSAPIYLTPSDPQPVVISHTYDARTQTSYNAILHFTLPSNCPDVPIPVNLGPPCPVNCCPTITNVTIDVGACRSDCTRAVTIKTDFLSPSAVCQAETLQWYFFDKNGNAITNVSSNAFLSSGVSPNVQSFFFDPAGAPITAKLTGLQYPDCVDTVRTIDIKPCNEPPACPTIHLFSASVMGCENVGGKCLRRVEFTLNADIAAGCGSNAGTKIEIDFGDGDQTQLQYNSSGQYTLTASHHYAGGNYQATMTVMNPAQCLGQLLNVHVPACAQEDCQMDAPCPPLPTPPSWCLCKLCYIFSQKPNKGWCKAILTLVAIYVSLVIVGCFMGWVSFSSANSIWQNLGAAVSLIGTLPAVLWYSKKCSDCCTACALLLAMILAIICVIILAIYGVTLVWINGLLMLFGVFVSWLILNASCNDYADQNLTADTWCQD